MKLDRARMSMQVIRPELPNLQSPLADALLPYHSESFVQKKNWNREFRYNEVSSWALGSFWEVVNG